MADDGGVAETAADEAAESVAPGSVDAPVEPILDAIRHTEQTILARLDALAGTSDAPTGDPVTEETHDESPVPLPWTHRKPWGSDR